MNPSLFGLKAYFEDSDGQIIYILQKINKRGSLFSTLFDQQHMRFSEGVAKEYAAQIVLQLELLHTHQIYYGALDPHSVGIDENGYVCLQTFWTQDLFFKMHQFHNSYYEYRDPEYTAPEHFWPLFNSKMGFDKEIHHVNDLVADWYQLGILM